MWNLISGLDMLARIVASILVMGLLLLAGAPVAHYWLHWRWWYAFAPFLVWLVVFMLLVWGAIAFLKSADMDIG